jgi:uncharacterized membrane protein SpoIIM required for sporulation
VESRRDNSEAHFERLVKRLESAKDRKAFADLRELARLYRLHSARLAKFQTQARDQEAIRYLNGLCVRAYNLVYAPSRTERKASNFLLADLPAALARTRRLQLVTAGILLASLLAGASLGARGPRALTALVPGGMYPSEALEELATSHEARMKFLAREETSTVRNSFFGSYLFFNNTRVGLLSFAVGILGGAPSLLLVAYNGLTLGAFFSIFAGKPGALLFWAWIVPHGIPELLAIVLCSTGGLVLGIAMLAPGRIGRVAALREAGRHALQLFLASIPLFIVAALVESFVRESALSTNARFAVAGSVICGFCGYVIGIRRLARRQPDIDVSFLGGAERDFHNKPA